MSTYLVLWLQALQSTSSKMFHIFNMVVLCVQYSTLVPKLSATVSVPQFCLKTEAPGATSYPGPFVRNWAKMVNKNKIVGTNGPGGG